MTDSAQRDPATINSLPVELLRQILAACEASPQQLLWIALVSRRFADLTVELLYNLVTLYSARQAEVFLACGIYRQHTIITLDIRFWLDDNNVPPLVKEILDGLSPGSVKRFAVGTEPDDKSYENDPYPVPLALIDHPSLSAVQHLELSGDVELVAPNFSLPLISLKLSDLTSRRIQVETIERMVAALVALQQLL